MIIKTYNGKGKTSFPVPMCTSSWQVINLCFSLLLNLKRSTYSICYYCKIVVYFVIFMYRIIDINVLVLLLYFIRVNQSFLSKKVWKTKITYSYNSGSITLNAKPRVWEGYNYWVHSSTRRVHMNIILLVIEFNV